MAGALFYVLGPSVRGLCEIARTAENKDIIGLCDSFVMACLALIIYLS